MTFWKKLFGEDSADEVDYYREGLELLGVGKFHEALTSFRLALRDTPHDAAVLQQIAITYTRIGMTEEASKTYRQVLQYDSRAPGAHYGLAFLYLREGRREDGEKHLRAFLEHAPAGPEAQRHVAHARETLAGLQTAAVEGEERGG